MRIHYLPLLPALQATYRLWRGERRFAYYLGQTLNATRTDVLNSPLLLANPMAKQAVAERVDALLELGADDLAAEAARAAASAATDIPGDFRASLMICDDLGGGWTNRFAVEYALRHAPNPLEMRPTEAARFWITGVLWSSEPVSATTVQQAMSSAVYRTAYVLRHGRAANLGQLIRQEGAVMNQARCQEASLEADELDFTRIVISEHAEATDMPTSLSCLFGDVAAASLGFQAFGLVPRAGLSFALFEASRTRRCSRRRGRDSFP